MTGVQRFAVAVAGVLIDSAHRVLLIHERAGARQYGLPGGMVQDYETPEETLLREFELQTGVRIGIDYVVGVKCRPADDHAYLIVAYHCRLVSGSARITGHGDIDEVAWYDTRTLPTPLSPSVAPAIEAASLGGRGMVFSETQGEQARRRRFQIKRGG